MPGNVVERMNTLMAGGTTCQLWGMTETQAGTYTRPDDDPTLAARTAGRPSPGTEVRVVPLPGNEAAVALTKSGEGEKSEATQ